jgi:hypothetical protein
MTDDQSLSKCAKTFSALRVLPPNQQWRMVAAMGGAAAIVIAIMLGIAALLAMRPVGLVE